MTNKIVPPSSIFLGYLPKQLITRPEWLECPNVEVIANTSECISPAPPDRIDQFKHNHFGLYDSEVIAKAIIPENDSGEYAVFAYHVLPLVYHGGRMAQWDPWDKVRAALPIPDDQFDEHLGFDVVGYRPDGFFECSPLSCNGAAKNVSVNRYCLVDDVQQATALAKSFSMPDSRVEPAWGYVVVDVRRRRE